MNGNRFTFSVYIIKENDVYIAVCKEVDIVTEGMSENQAMDNLSEAVSLYVETAIESNLPILRPISPAEDLSITHPEKIIIACSLYIDFKVKAHA